MSLFHLPVLEGNTLLTSFFDYTAGGERPDLADYEEVVGDPMTFSFVAKPPPPAPSPTPSSAPSLPPIPVSGLSKVGDVFRAESSSLPLELPASQQSAHLLFRLASQGQVLPHAG